ncbi:TPA: hypothetical protein QCR36_004064 [Bacillus cereus]|nr:hypothetical protein [Bacillus cereus]HDR4742530.1 hypothetical protein [Bacillus cereus]HDR4748117.1 hypothetical protein [Bacillus cereus]HDR4753591.1 hypothetical protein [Bacillus cereus]HDR4770800.1 hypothetical protein [Bacillus cereus]
MKIESITFKGIKSTEPPKLVATGPVGGGYVAIDGANTLGTSEFISDPTQYIVVVSEKVFYLLEGEKLYSRGEMNTAYDRTIKVTYLNPQPSSQNNNPLSFTGTINLSQS